MSTPAASVQPGDIFVVVVESATFRWIERGEALIDHDLIKRRKKAGMPVYGHAGIASRRMADGTLMIVQAEPHGAEEVPWALEGSVHLWSTGILPPCPAAGAAALRYAGLTPDGMGWHKTGPGVGYSFLDYLAIAAHSQHLPVPGLQSYIASTGHMICSQLADQCRSDGGSHLFNDGRWPGYVSPLDLGLLLEGIQ